ncbi:MAG TPA: sensor histidine kinase [Ruminococcaceae bacterium]|jgi:two-component system sensor histidine kinase YesM|nr:sensor histidine kinase [Oscillospiraceae bacterium]
MKKFLSVRFVYFGAAIGCLASVLSLIGLLAAWRTKWFVPFAIVLALLFCALLLACFFLWKPYCETTRIIKIFAASLSTKEIDRIQVHYNPQMKLLGEHLKESMKMSSAFELSKRQAQYQALQNQINPHFLYNTLESIRSEALLAGLDSVADMCEALACFFRYTISNMKDLVAIEDEIQNIRNYFYIQQYRFGSRLKLVVDCDEEDRDVVVKCTIPKLTLQPIVENAIIHGIEQKIGEGIVTIKFILTETRVIIEVMDNGVGMDEKTLEKINENMQDRILNHKDGSGIAIANVNNRIKLLFGEDYGIVVYSTVGVGTDVEIALPRTMERRKEFLRDETEGAK